MTLSSEYLAYEHRADLLAAADHERLAAVARRSREGGAAGPRHGLLRRLAASAASLLATAFRGQSMPAQHGHRAG